jgi:hypothetical protein
MGHLTHFPQKYLQAMIDERKALRASGQVPNDILSNLVALNEDHHDGNTMSLSDEEMRGSPCLSLRRIVIDLESTTGTCIALQGAGYDTTAHSLDFIFRLLALHPEVQEELYRNIRAVKTDATPLVSTTTFSFNHTEQFIDVYRCTQTELCFGSNIRSASHVPDRQFDIHRHCINTPDLLHSFSQIGATHRIAEYDTTLEVERFDGRRITIPVPKNSSVSFSAIGMHYDRELSCINHKPLTETASSTARHWDEPYEFRPQRFLQDYDKQSFAPFLSGPHACIGRR